MKKVSVLALALGGILGTTLVHADDKEYSLRIERQPLVATLRALSQQTGLQVVGMLGGDPEEERRLVGPLHGEFTAEAALTKLLEQSDLAFKRVNERTIAIVGKPSTPQDNATTTPAAATDWKKISSAAETASEGEPMRVATRSSSMNEISETPGSVDPEEVIVTGSHIRGAQPVGSNVVVVTRKEIESSGYARVQDFFETLPQSFSGVGEDGSQARTANTNRGSEIQLRGLGPGTTLTLVNGRRQPAGGATGAFIDISSIPASAIERIEILPDGASAVYGSDAIGGVVNFILRKDYEGAETSARYGSAGGDADDVQISQLFGTHWSSGQVLVGYNYSQHDPLYYGDREYLATNGDQRRFGGGDFRRDAARRGSNPGNILCPATGSFGCTPSQPAFAIPAGQDGTGLTTAQLLRGEINYFDSSLATILPEQETHSAFINASQDVGERVQIEMSARYGKRKSEIALPGGSISTVAVPSTNPFYLNPFGGTADVRVEYDFSKELGLPTDTGDTETMAGTLSGVMALGGDWKIRVSGSYGEESVEHFRINLRDDAATLAALRDTNPATALNVFGNGSNANPETLARLRTSSFDDATSSTWSTDAIVDGPLFDLPGGTARLAAGVDYRKEEYDLVATYEIRGEAHGERAVTAGFAELSLPLLARRTATNERRPGLEMSLAGRLDDYDDVGSTFNPRVGLNWLPLDWFKVRGTWGTSFRAPPFYLSNSNLAPSRVSATTLNDPASPSGRTSVLILSGAMPGLKEETAEVWTAGLDVMPIENLMVSLTYFDIAYEDKIQAASTATALALESQFVGTGVVRRNPTQAEITTLCTQPGVTVNCNATYGAILDGRLRNLAVVDVEGIDLGVSHGFDTSIGSFHSRLSATYTLHYNEAITEVSPQVDVIDTFERPLALRLRGSFGWSRLGWSLNAGVSHQGSYRNPATTPASRIDSWTTVDVSGGYDFSGSNGWLSDLRMLLSVTNVADKEPPFVNHFLGFDAANGNLIGRTFSLQMIKGWGQGR